MNKARKKRYRRSAIKRLVQESFVLSSTSRLSSRFVRIFESGFASPLLKSAKKTDDFAREKITGPLFNKTGFRKNFSMPTRNAVSSFIARSRTMQTIGNIRNAFLTTSLRSVGVFLFTFGIYAAAIFLLKSYISIALGSGANVDDLAFAAVSALAGLIFICFGDKSIIHSVGNGKIVGQLLLKCLGVNESSVDKNSSESSRTNAGFAFLLGSLFGAVTLFFTPASVMLFIFAAMIIIGIFHIPEFGLLITATCFSFVSVKTIGVVVAVTLASFLIKCLRLKRNLSFGTADAAMLLLFVAMSISCITSQGSITRRELYVLCFTSVYFLAKNLICSEKLVYQTLNALCTGLEFGMALYILGDFATLIPHNDIRMAAVWLTQHTLDTEMLMMSVAMILPFALSSFSKIDIRRRKRMFILLALVCAVISDIALFYVLLVISALVFFANAYKAPMGALLSAVVAIPTVSILAYDFTSSSVVAERIRMTYDDTLHQLVEKDFGNLWTGLSNYGGGVIIVIFVLALLLIFQRVYGSMVGNNGNRASLLGGTVAASVINMLVCSFVFDPFSHMQVFTMIWFILGFSGFTNKPSISSRHGE